MQRGSWWIRQDNGRVVHRAMMDYVVVLRNIIGLLLDVRVLRGEGGGMSNPFLVEGNLKIDRWMKNTKVGETVLKVS